MLLENLCLRINFSEGMFRKKAKMSKLTYSIIWRLPKKLTVIRKKKKIPFFHEADVHHPDN